MKLLLRIALALPVLVVACDPGSIPNRNVSDVTHEVVVLTPANHQLVVRNPNSVRVGTEFRLRVFREGQRPPLRESLDHVYVPASMSGTLDIDLSDVCDPDAPPAGTPEFVPGSGEGSGDEAAELPPPRCDELRVTAVLLQTYWLADE